MKPISLLLVLTLALVSACTQTNNSVSSSAVNAVTIRGHIETLANDDMEGRETGSAGYLRAAAYVAGEFDKAGLQPVGDNGTYFQNIDFISSRLAPNSGAITLQRADQYKELILGEDFIQFGGFGDMEDSVTAPLVFVGFGIEAPEYNHDDYAELDPAGKIVIAFSGAPPDFTSSERAFYSSSAEKRKLATAKGAVGFVTVYTPVDQERLPWARLKGFVGSPDMRWVNAEGAAAGRASQLVGSASLSDQGARKMFEMASLDLDGLFETHLAGGTSAIELGVTASISRRSEQSRISSPNVIGLVPGSDPVLRDEVLLYSAHLDHLGIHADGEVYNGAIDNAAGVGIILEVARVIAGLSPAPKRSIIFVAYTAEEKGLRGSDYLAHHPPVPIENIVANINVDMPVLLYPIADVEGFGAEHSSLNDVLKEAAGRKGIAVTPDSRPDLVRLIRSDQFSLVKKGVPGFNVKPGGRSADPAIDGASVRDDFLNTHYHDVTDDLNLPFNEEGAQIFAEIVLETGLIVANAEGRPHWNERDFFGDMYGGENRGN